MEIKTIGLASDHAGYALKQFVKKYLEEKGYEFKDYGTYTEDSCDYSDFGHALAEGIEKGRAEGIAEGEHSKSLDIARRLKSKGVMTDAEIAEMTGLSVDEVAKI